jgi:uncharacterized protein YndB with AHSA1/START domain
MSDRIENSIDLAAPIERVWRALTDHVEFGAWFRLALDGPFVLGETSSGHVTYPGYEHLTWEARIVEMEAPYAFAFEWHPAAVDPNTDYSREPATRVRFTLRSSEPGTHLTVVESGFDAIPADRREVAYRMNEGGWAEQMRNIEAHVTGV